MEDGKAENEKVIFRVFRDGDVIALFPEIATDNLGYHCQSYMHVGQHGGADPFLVKTTRLAKPDEYKDLYDELTSIGYSLKVIKKFRYKHLQIRQDMYK